MQILSESVLRRELAEMEAVEIVKKALYINAANLYHVDVTGHMNATSQ
jgi:hypothetical protein